jgi:hypothetical protein
MVRGTPMMSPLIALRHVEALGRRGYTISIACGPSGAEPFRWSVLVQSPNGDEFDQPFAADSFAHAVMIAELEIVNRGWEPIT